MKYLILILLCILLVACDALTGNSSSSGSYNIQKDITGSWSVSTADGKSSSVYISATSSTLSFIGGTYTGSYSGNYFSGSIKNTYDKWSLSLSMDSKNSISGDVIYSAGGKSSSFSFTGTR